MRTPSLPVIAPPFIALALAFAAGAARAQTAADPPAGAADASGDGLRDFCAQRPGRATPPCILDAGHLQIETGLADAVFQHEGGAHEDTYAIAITELRWGVSRRIELEASWTPWVVDQTRGQPRETGTGDASLAVMAALTDPDKMGPAVSAQAFVTLPTATRGLGAGGFTGGVRLPMAVPLDDSFSLGLTPEVDILRNDTGGGTHTAWAGVASLGRSFGPVSLGAELWAQAEASPGGVIRRATADLTGALMIGKTLQLDAGANFGLNRQTPGAELYVGVSQRF
jgi:hypothetical protein